MITLGIESSCDETSVALVRGENEILANVVLSQPDHSRFGGVVPEVASRVHLRTIVPIFREALDKAGIAPEQISLVAATIGPGLVGPLLVGLSFAKGFAAACELPFVGVNHIEGHLVAPFLTHPDLNVEHLSLIVSGGHTLLVAVQEIGNYEIIGQTRDDAAGEAFDKVAKLLGLGYPGGAALDALARKGDPTAYLFTRPYVKDDPHAFSFSGLKTAVALILESLGREPTGEERENLAASFQEAVVESLVSRAVAVAQARRFTHVTVTGGVAANSRLRALLGERVAKIGAQLFAPPLSLCGDNAAMIAAAGFRRFSVSGPMGMAVNAVPYLPLESWKPSARPAGE